MGLVCQLIAQPIITVIHVLVTLIEYVLVQICRLIQELVNAIVQVLKYVCNTIVHTVCGAVCSVVCGICDFFCGIFGCDCGCENVCNNVCNTVTEVVCGWTYVLESVLQWVTRLVCTYILQALIKLLDIIETFVTMLLTWVCTLIDVFVRGILCWTHLGDIFNNTKPRRFRVAPKIIRNKQGYSDWFVYVNNPTPAGNVDQNVRGYILSDLGRPLAPVVDGVTGAIAYYEVVTRGNVITGELKRKDGREGGFVAGRPFLYYAYKVMEIASHMWGDIFATVPGDDGHGTDFHKNLLTYNPHVQAWLNGDGKLAANTYNAWNGKYTNAASIDYFGDLSVPDMGMRVDTDNCSRPTNTFLHLIHGDIGFTPGNTGVAEDMTCGAGETLSFEDTNFLMVNKDSNGAAVTTYFVSMYNMDDSQVGCNDILGYTIVTFEGSQQPLFTSMRVLPFEADTNRMMSRIVERDPGSRSQQRNPATDPVSSHFARGDAPAARPASGVSQSAAGVSAGALGDRRAAGLYRQRGSTLHAGRLRSALLGAGGLLHIQALRGPRLQDSQVSVHRRPERRCRKSPSQHAGHGPADTERCAGHRVVRGAAAPGLHRPH